MRHAVASYFEDGRRFWVGQSRHVPGVSFEPLTTTNTEEAITYDRSADAAAVASALSESCSDLPPRDARTWFVFMLHGPRR